MRGTTLALLVIAATANKVLKDGDCVFIDAGVDPDIVFTYTNTEESKGEDLRLTVTIYSSSQPLHLCAGFGAFPNPCNYSGTSIQPWVSIPGDFLKPGAVISALVICGQLCRFRLTVTRSNPALLKLNKAVWAVSDSHGVAGFRYKARVDGRYRVTAIGQLGKVALAASIDHSLEAKCVEFWDDRKVCDLALVAGMTVDFVTTAGRPHELVLAVRAIQGVEEYGAVLELLSATPATGTLAAGGMVEYSYKLLQKKSHLEVALSQYAGDSDLLVAAAPNCKEAKVASSRPGNDIISLSRSDRSVLFNQTHGWFYICLTATEDSAYSLTVTETMSVRKWLMFDIEERGELALNQFAYYQIPVGEQETMEIEITVAAFTGNPDLYVILCLKDTCVFNERMVHHPEDCKLQTDGIFHSANKDGVDTVTISHSAGTCGKECQYTVGVLGRSKDNSLYAIVARVAGRQSHIILTSRVAYQAKNPRAGLTYFKYSVTSAATTRLEVLLSPLIGNPDLFISRTQQFPSRTAADFFSANLGSMDEFIVLKSTPLYSLVGDYFIAVESTTPSSFSLSVSDTRTNSHLIYELTQGVTSTLLLDSQETIEAIITVALNSTDNRDLRLTAFPDYGRMTACVAYYRKTDTCIWTFQCDSAAPFDCVFVIPANDSRFLAHFRYSAVITVDSATETRVNICYTAGSHMKLRQDDSHKDIVDGGKYLYYSLTLFPPWLSITISEQVISGDIDLYVSVATEKYPANSTADIVGNSGFEDKVIVSNSLLRAKCGVAEFCVVYLAVKGTLRTAFHLYIHGNNKTSFPLIDGTAIYQHNWMGGELTFQLHLSRQGNAEADIEVLEGSLSVHTSLVPSKHSQADYWSLPVLSAQGITDSFTSKLTEEEIRRQCTVSCALQVVVTCQSPYCWLAATGVQSQHRVLTLSSPIADTVLQGEIHYYALYFSAGFVSLRLELTIEGEQSDADLYVTPGTAVVALSRFRWKSEQRGSDSITIGERDCEEHCTGYFLAAVLGRVQCAYTLTLDAESAAIRPLRAAPRRLRMQPHTSRYFYFPVHFNEDLVVEAMLKRGEVALYLSSYTHLPNSTDYPSQQQYHWRSCQSSWNHETIVVSREDAHFCYNCTYVLLLRNDGNSGAECNVYRSPRTGPEIELISGFKYAKKLPTGAAARLFATDCEPGTAIVAEVLTGHIALFAYIDTSATSPHWRTDSRQGLAALVVDSELDNVGVMRILAVAGSDAVVVAGMQRRRDTRETFDGFAELVWIEESRENYLVGSGMHWEVSAFSGIANFSVTEYAVVDENLIFLYEHSLSSPNSNLFLRSIAGDCAADSLSHLISIHSLDHPTRSHPSNAFLRLSVSSQQRILPLNSEQFGTLSVAKPSLSYRIEAVASEVEVEVTVEFCEQPVAVSVISVLLDGSSRSEPVTTANNNRVRTVLSLEDVKEVIVEVSALEVSERFGFTHFAISAIVVNQLTEITTGSQVHIDSVTDTRGKVSWSPATFSPHPSNPPAVSYRLYVTHEEITTTCELKMRGEMMVYEGENTWAEVETGLWATVLACEVGGKSTSVCSYALYQSVHVVQEETQIWAYTAWIVGITFLLLSILFILRRRKARNSQDPLLQMRELSQHSTS